jgi:hypothetical protein
MMKRLKSNYEINHIKLCPSVLELPLVEEQGKVNRRVCAIPRWNSEEDVGTKHKVFSSYRIWISDIVWSTEKWEMISFSYNIIQFYDEQNYGMSQLKKRNQFIYYDTKYHN